MRIDKDLVKFENEKNKCFDEIQLLIERIEILEDNYLKNHPDSQTYLTILECCLRCLNRQINQLKNICEEYGFDYKEDMRYRRLIFELKLLDVFEDIK